MKCGTICVACVLGRCALLLASSDFENVVTNALWHKEYLASDAFTNYVCQCANQSNDVNLALSANLILAVSRFEKFEQTMDDAFLASSLHSVSNVLTSGALTTDMWQYWHARMMEITCLGTYDNLQGAYHVASNSWDAIQASGFVDSTNIVSRALLRYYRIGDDVTIKAAIALSKALAADMIGRHSEANAMKQSLPERIKQEMEDFLGE